MAKVKLDCPQCGQDNSGQPGKAVECSQCRTLLIYTKGATRTALQFDGLHFPTEDSTVALVCRVCGAAWPLSATQTATGSKCSYCGHPAVLPPSLQALLKVTFTHPQALPASLRAMYLHWGLVVGVFVLLIALNAFLPSPRLSENQELALTTTSRQETSEGARYLMDLRSETINVRSLGNRWIYSNVAVYPERSGGFDRSLIPNAEMRLRISVVQESTGAQREFWISLWDNPNGLLKDVSATSHPYSSLPLGENWKPATWPPGKYHLLFKEAVMRGGELPPKVTIEWRSSESNRNLFFILLANVILWLFVFDLRRLAGHPLQGSNLSWLNAVALAACLVLLIDVIYPLPWRDQGRFMQDLIENTAGVPHTP